MKKTILLLLFLPGILTHLPAQETVLQYLSGIDKEHAVPWEFFCTKGRNSGVWSSLPVPSLWDQQGFGFDGANDKSEELGLYRFSFSVSKDWQNKKIFLVFEGVLSHATVKLNGKPASDAYQSGFYQFSYDVSSLLKFEESNLLEVKVSNPSVAGSKGDKDDSPVGAGGGIFAPVYLKILPEVYVERVAIDAKANGNITAQVISRNTQPSHILDVQVQDMYGRIVGTPMQVNATENAEIKKQFPGIKTWNPETPNLYQVVVSIKDGENTLHTYRQRFGFRTSEVREGEGFFVNGARVIFKGVNRRSAESDIVVSREGHLAYVTMLRDMNMNAVRLANFPPNPEFLDLCDSMGLFVINELNASSFASDTSVGKKVIRNLVLRDVNHPSVVMWSNGNDIVSHNHESEYARYDLQQRFIIRPAAKFGDAKKNSDFNTVANSILYGSEVFSPSEFSHGLYSGGYAAGLDDFWTEMLKQPKFSGGFLWSFRDENTGNVLTGLDAYRAVDASDKPGAEKGASYCAIKEIWSPIAIETRDMSLSFNGSLNIENRFLYTNLNKCRFDWKLLLYPKATEKRLTPVVLGEGTAPGPFLGPGEKGVLKLNVPAGMNNADALLLVAYDAKGREIATWSYAVHRPADVVKTIPEVASISTIMTVEDEEFISVVVDGINYIFSKKNGNLSKVYCGKRDIPFVGPLLAGNELTLTEFKHYEKDRIHYIETNYKGDNWLTVKWTFQTGDLPKMEYQYAVKNPPEYMGILFSYPEEKITGLKWLGRGPFKVWKNRMKGMQLGVWEKTKTNANTPAGEVFKNGEVKGWHSELYWAQFQTIMGSFTIYSEQPNIFLQYYKPERAANTVTEFSIPPFPSNGSIGFMHNISAIGTKLQSSDNSVSKSLKSAGDGPLSGILWIDFRH